MIFQLLHPLLTAAYFLLPIAALARLFLARKRRAAGDPNAPQLAALLMTLFCAALIAVPLCFAYGHGLGGRVPATQVFLAIYFALSMLLLLKCIDSVLLFVLRRATLLHRPAGGTFSRAARTLLVLVVRAALLATIAIPTVLAMMLVYRPKVISAADPLTRMGYDVERVEFTASDGTKLVGWWIPSAANEDAPPRPWRRRSRNNAERTSRDPAGRDPAGRAAAIVCPGIASGKANQSVIARALLTGGFNVLVLDFRAQGESAGQLTTFGELESRDVLAAVHFLREHHKTESQRVVGVGVSSGAAALIKAAADPGPDGQSISALALYSAYDNFHAVLQDDVQLFFRPPMPALIEYLALPIASLHTGVDLTHAPPAAAAAPDRDIAQIWPRPILFLHGEYDEIIPIERAQSLYDAASLPKYYIWFPKTRYTDLLQSDPAARITTEFLRTARAVPII